MNKTSLLLCAAFLPLGLAASPTLAHKPIADRSASEERSAFEADRADPAADAVRDDLRRLVLDRVRRLLRSWKDGQARLNAYLEDHAFLVEALLTLYEATFEPRWFAAARVAFSIPSGIRLRCRRSLRISKSSIPTNRSRISRGTRSSRRATISATARTS